MDRSKPDFAVGKLGREFAHLVAERGDIIAALRAVFDAYGFDAAGFSDEELSEALRINSETPQSVDQRLERTIARLTGNHRAAKRG